MNDKSKESRGFILLLVGMVLAATVFLGAIFIAGLDVASNAAFVAGVMLVSAGGTASARAIKDMIIGKAQAQASASKKNGG